MGGVITQVAKIAATVGMSLGGPAMGASFGNFILSAFNPVSMFVNIAMTVASQAMTKKPKSSALAFNPGGGLISQATNRTQMIQQSITEDRIVYGQVLLSGPLAFAESYDDKASLSLAPVLADHQIAAQGEVFFNDEHVPFNSPVASGKYLNLAEITRHLGTDDQAADSGLVAISGGNWTNDHRGRGRAYAHFKLTFDRDKFANGIPTPKVVVSGKLMWDPRDTGATIVSSTASGSLVSIETSSAHGLVADNRVFIKDHITAAPAVDGHYGVLSVSDATHFIIRLGFDLAGDEISLTTGGTAGTATKCVFMDNPAVIMTDYLLDKTIGEGADVDEVDLTAAIAAANICDEWVSVLTDITFTASAGADEVTLTSGAAALRKGEPVTLFSTTALPGGLSVSTVCYWISTTGSTTVGQLATSRANALAGTAIDITDAGTGTHTLTRAATTAFSVGDASRDELDQDTTTPAAFCLGDKVQLLTTNTLPAGLSVLTDYFYVPLTPTKFKLATSRDNALAATIVDVTDSGTGTHLIQRRAEPRYTCNGTIDTAEPPHENIETLRSAMAGVVVPIGGKFTMFAGASTASTETMVDEDLRAGIQVIPQRGKKARFNTCAGLFVNPSKLYEPDELPPVTSQTYRDEDNGETISKQFELPVTNSVSMGMRVLKIELGHNRHQTTVLFPCNIAGLRFQPWDVFQYTNSRFGWSAQDFRVISWKFDPGDAKRQPSVDIVARIETSAMWSWAQATDELAKPPGPINTLPRADDIDPPSSFAVTSGTATLGTAGDGTQFARGKLAWTAPSDAYLRGYEVAWKKAADSNWESNIFDAPQDEYFVEPLISPVDYDFAIRSINTLGVRSDTDDDPSTWTAYVAAHTVIGKEADPSDVVSLFAQQSKENVLFKWPAITDADRAGYGIRYAPQSSFEWADATPISDELIARGTTITTAAIPPGDWTFGIKAYDTSENESANATTVDLTVSNALDVIDTIVSHDAWLGTLTNMVKHHTGVLVPDSQTLASAMTDAQLWNQCTYNPYADCYFTDAEYDMGFDASNVRAWAAITSVLGPGESGTASPQYQLDYKTAAGSYDGFEDWEAGAIAGRYVKGRIHVASSAGVPVISAFTQTLDFEERTETHADQTIAASGTTVSFTDRFHNAPTIRLTVKASTGLYATYETPTVTGVVVHVWNSSGTDVGGTVTVEATGV